MVYSSGYVPHNRIGYSKTELNNKWMIEFLESKQKEIGFRNEESRENFYNQVEDELEFFIHQKIWKRTETDFDKYNTFFDYLLVWLEENSGKTGWKIYAKKS